MKRLNRLAAACGMLCLVAVGCAPQKTLFRVVDYRDGDGTRSYTQGFDECYYTVDAHDNVDIVARHSTLGESGVPTTQVIHMHTFWRARPGRTYAERTMINATVSYMMLSNPSGAAFEGSGFLTFREKPRKGIIVGELELSTLKPCRRVGRGDKIFDRAELSGTFVARRDKRASLEILHEMNRCFGPLPAHDPNSGDNARR